MGSFGRQFYFFKPCPEIALKKKKTVVREGPSGKWDLYGTFLHIGSQSLDNIVTTFSCLPGPPLHQNCFTCGQSGGIPDR